MALVMHALRPGDLFVDVGGNIGSYTVLAAGVCQASVIAIEPVLSAFDRLEENVRLNNLSSRVVTKNVALGSEGGGVPVSVGFDARNHVLGVGLPGGELTTVPLATLDSVLDGSEPTVIKIDVEGYEAAVVAGATRAFQSTSLLVVIMESNGQGYRYGFDEQALEATMIQGGFTRCSYDPYTRALSPLSAARAGEDNVLYVKNCGALSDRVRTAPRRPVHGSSL
jgi:FkbM family methyltransferase